MTALLAAAITLAIVYGAFFSVGGPSFPKLIFKAGATTLLAAWAYSAGAPPLLIAALALSALGDAFLVGEGDKWLLPGMAAFFAAHVAYVGLFWGEPATPHTALNLTAQTALIIAGIAMIWRVAPAAGPLRIPVIAYAAVILMMGAAALRLPEPHTLAIAGALLFILSDALLAEELFIMDKAAAIRRLTSRTVWATYFGGQSLIAAAFLT